MFLHSIFLISKISEFRLPKFRNFGMHKRPEIPELQSLFTVETGKRQIGLIERDKIRSMTKKTSSEIFDFKMDIFPKRSFENKLVREIFSIPPNSVPSLHDITPYNHTYMRMRTRCYQMAIKRTNTYNVIHTYTIIHTYMYTRIGTYILTYIYIHICTHVSM